MKYLEIRENRTNMKQKPFGKISNENKLVNVHCAQYTLNAVRYDSNFVRLIAISVECKSVSSGFANKQDVPAWRSKSTVQYYDGHYN